MRTITVMAALVLAAAAFRGLANEDVATAPAPDFSFLEGSWVGELGGTPMEEFWMPTRDGNMTGCLRWFGEDGSVQMYELFSITSGEDGAVFRLRHFDTEFRPWETEVGGPKVFRIEPTDGGARFVPVDAESQIASGEYSVADGEMTFHLEFRTDREPLEIRFGHP